MNFQFYFDDENTHVTDFDKSGLQFGMPDQFQLQEEVFFPWRTKNL